MSTEAAGAGAQQGTSTTGTTEGTQSTQSTTQQGSAQGSTDWTTSLSPDAKAYVQTKGFKDVGAVLDSYRNYEKAMGTPAEHLIKLPKEMDSPEGRAVWERLGAPKEAKDYKIEIPKEHGDEKLAESLREVAHKNNFTHKQVEGLVKWWNERTSSEIKTFQEAHQTKMTQENESLKKEWGGAYEQNKNIANRAARLLGMDQEVLQAIGEKVGPAKAFKALYDLGVKLGESKFVSGEPAGTSVLAPSAAQAEINSLMQDPAFAKRLAQNETEAVSRWNKLNQQAFGQH